VRISVESSAESAKMSGEPHSLRAGMQVKKVAGWKEGGKDFLRRSVQRFFRKSMNVFLTVVAVKISRSWLRLDIWRMSVMEMREINVQLDARKKMVLRT